MNAGAMDVLVSLQHYTETIDSNTGEKLQTWTEYATAWAQRIEQESGVEQVNADRREHRQIIYYVVRYNSAINVKDRVVENGKQLNIVRSEEHTSELQSRFGISYAVFCL